MSQTSEQPVIRQSPLDEEHARIGATMTERDGRQIPASYGDTPAEYAAVRDVGAGLIDLSTRGRILVGGSEAVPFLNGLITNDMKSLVENSWMPAAFPNVQGRLIAGVRVIRVKNEGTGKNVCPTYLIDTEAVTHDRVLKALERFTLAGDFRVSDITNQTAQFTLQGKRSAEPIRSLMGEEAANVPSDGAIRTAWEQTRMTVLRATHTGENGFDVIANSVRAVELWNALLNAGARPVGHDALEILRLEAGIPRYGVDMDETNVVTEALDDAVSYTKGCYVGQEIIARIKYRGHVAKRLSGIAFNQTAQVEAGATIKSLDGKDIGRITSVTFSPRLNCTIALGYLKYDYISPGTDVKAASGEQEFPGQVTELPFVRGSWQTE
jgi:folate-binding protein YgfZ